MLYYKELHMVAFGDAAATDKSRPNAQMNAVPGRDEKLEFQPKGQ